MYDLITVENHALYYFLSSAADKFCDIRSVTVWLTVASSNLLGYVGIAEQLHRYCADECDN